MSTKTLTCVVCNAPATRTISINNGDDVVTMHYCTEHYQETMNEIYRRVDDEIEKESDIHHSKDR